MLGSFRFLLFLLNILIFITCFWPLAFAENPSNTSSFNTLLWRSPSPSQTCTKLEFVTAGPVGSSKMPECDVRADSVKCKVLEGYSHFNKVKVDQKHVYELGQYNPSLKELTDYLYPLDQSRMIQEVNSLRILARKIAGSKNPCEPNYIYVGSNPIFGMGPAFVSSTRFIIDGQITTNFIAAEDAKGPFYIPISLLSKDSLIRNHYYETVIAHELAHGLMQDLYGVDEFTKLEGRVISRDGHFASATTDPTLAWIEGFAEGFEAYLGEKYLTAEELKLPFLEKLQKKIDSRIELFQNYGWPLYAMTIPLTVPGLLITSANMEDFTSDFLKAERQEAIRENHYILKGVLNNLTHKLNFVPNSMVASPEDTDDVLSYAYDSLETIYSKEGVVAFLVYSILKADLKEELFDTIAWSKPRDLWEFTQAFFRTVSVQKTSQVNHPFSQVFFESERAKLASSLMSKYFASTQLVANSSPKIHELSLSQIPPPSDLWVEFWSHEVLHQQTRGHLDRIHLLTASVARFRAFVATIGLPKAEQKQIVDSWIYFKKQRPEASSIRTRIRRDDPVESLLTEYAHSLPQHLKTLGEFFVKRTLQARNCFLEGCVEKASK